MGWFVNADVPAGPLVTDFCERLYPMGRGYLSTAGMMIFLTYSLWSMLTSPDTAKFASSETARAFSDCPSGGGCIAVYALVGVGLMWFSRAKKRLL